jgi:protein TonB
MAAIGALACASSQIVAPLWRALPTRDGHHSIELIGAMESATANTPPVAFEPSKNDAESGQSHPERPDRLLEPRRLAEDDRLVPTPVNSPVPPPLEKISDERVAAAPREISDPPMTRRDSSQDGEAAPRIDEPSRKLAAAPLAARQGTTARLPPAVVEPESPVAPRAAQASQAQPTSRRADGAESEPAPRVRFNPPPEYPASALRAGVEGRVVLRVELTRDGRVAAATVQASSGHESLDEAALAAVRRWRFEPVNESAGRSASARIVAVPVRFEIEK